MAPLPKRKYAKARQGDRRSHLHLLPQTLGTCPQCNSPKPFHQVCPTCGYYDGRQAIQVKSAAKG